MPQMAPLNWLTLMIMFIMIMLTFNLINYFTFNYTIQKTSKSTSETKKINWKW